MPKDLHISQNLALPSPAKKGSPMLSLIIPMKNVCGSSSAIRVCFKQGVCFKQDNETSLDQHVFVS